MLPLLSSEKHHNYKNFKLKVYQCFTYVVCLTEICRSPAGESLASMITFFCVRVPSLAELSGASSWMVKISSCSGKSSSRAVSSRKMEFWLQNIFVSFHCRFRQLQVTQFFFLLIFVFVFNILYLSVLKCDDSLCRS